MFTEEQVKQVFSNINQLHLFHQDILSQLEECLIDNNPSASQIGTVFVNNISQSSWIPDNQVVSFMIEMVLRPWWNAILNYTLFFL